MITRFKYEKKDGTAEEKEVLVLLSNEESLYGIDLDKYPKAVADEIKKHIQQAAKLLRSEPNTFRHYKNAKITERVDAEIYLTYSKKDK
jgi:hypothetical protein